MSPTDWYRRTTWSADDEAEFERRLSRARGSRSEYLRIQAFTLAETGDALLAEPAIRLATRYLQENPAGISRAQVLCTVARASEAKGDVPRTVEAYRQAIEVERLGGFRCMAYLDFAWFAATHERSELFHEVLAGIEASMQNDDLLFPAAQYRYFGALAVISAHFGDLPNARRMARNAMEAASRTTGPFPRHPTVGLVSEKDRTVLTRIERLAG